MNTIATDRHRVGTLGEGGDEYRILIIDDDGSQRRLEKEVLSAGAYRITEVEDGVQGLQILAREEFDVVLLDKCMPGIDGDQVCRKVRQELGLTLLPIIMVTGSDSDDEMQKSMQAGASDFVRKPFSTAELLARVNSAATHKRLTDQMDDAESLLFALARMVEAKDTNTGDHCSRLAHISVVFGTALGLDRSQLIALQRGGVLHDIGKLGIPESILLKPGPLNEREWVVMRQHTVIGEQICSGLQSMRATLPIIRSHHERWDGSGYPDGLAKEQIPFLARVFQIADIYDALSHKRPYKKAMGIEQVTGIMEMEVKKGWRDPELMAVFLDIVRNRPQDLQLPDEFQQDKASRIFESIRRTGVLDWR